MWRHPPPYRQDCVGGQILDDCLEDLVIQIDLFRQIDQGCCADSEDKGLDLRVQNLPQHKHFDTATAAETLGKFGRNYYPGKAKRAEGVAGTGAEALRNSTNAAGFGMSLDIKPSPALCSCVEITPSCKTVYQESNGQCPLSTGLCHLPDKSFTLGLCQCSVEAAGEDVLFTDILAGIPSNWARFTVNLE
ncbi:hypothetical protein WISP_37544 [Willisornis vidua]|uniref:Uncharacterized protein n=1 Tax=Willisornis vidua TaxID=1566151 RepID=A0ABQ9DIN7_9PASS|nr:hypothetical protein WISP_37544 [Willisornis vidua]